MCQGVTVQVYEIPPRNPPPNCSPHTGTLLGARLLPRSHGAPNTVYVQAPGPAVTVSPIRNCNANAPQHLRCSPVCVRCITRHLHEPFALLCLFLLLRLHYEAPSVRPFFHRPTRKDVDFDRARS